MTRTDATGTAVTLTAEPTRIVTLNPSAAQTLWEIGARERVVGVTEYATYLDGAERREIVSTDDTMVSVERVVGLEPDLVLAPNATSKETIEKLRDAGVTLYHEREPEDLDDVAAQTETTGRLVGACDGATATVTKMERDLAVVREAAANASRPDVLYSFYGYTAGRGTFVHALIEAAGANNVAADANITGYKPVNAEFVVDADPEWIVRNDGDPAVPETAAYNSTTAVREGQVIVVPIEFLNQPAPRVVRAVTTMASAFHPDAYAAAESASSSPDATASAGTKTTGTDARPGESEPTAENKNGDETGTRAAAGGDSPSPPTGGGVTETAVPGFGAGATLVALCLAAFGVAGRRRRP